MPVFAPPKAAPPAPVAKPAPAAKTPKPKAAPKPKKPKATKEAPELGPVVTPVVDPSGYRLPSPRDTAPRMGNEPAKRFADMPIRPVVDGVDWLSHRDNDYPENHLTYQYAERIKDASDEVVARMPAAQRAALSAYTGMDYHGINSYLRDGDKAFRRREGDKEADRIRGLSENLTVALRSMPRPPGNVVLMRGLALAEDDPQFDQIAAGSEITFKSFGSFSRDPAVAREFSTSTSSSARGSIVYRVRRHIRGAILEGVSKYASEREVLFPPSTRFRIVGRQRVGNSRVVVDLEEITDD